MPVAWLTTEYGDPSAWAAYESVPLWLTCEDSGPSRTVASAVFVVLPPPAPRDSPLLSNGSATATTTPAAAISTRTTAPASSRLRRLRVRGVWRSGWGGLGAGTPGPGTLVLIGALIGHRRRRRLGAGSGRPPSRTGTAASWDRCRRRPEIPRSAGRGNSPRRARACRRRTSTLGSAAGCFAPIRSGARAARATCTPFVRPGTVASWGQAGHPWSLGG